MLRDCLRVAYWTSCFRENLVLMSRIVLLLIIASTFLVFGCDGIGQSELPKAKLRELTVNEKLLVDSNVDFSLKLLKQLVAQESANKNIVISPLSVSAALGMTLNGAAGLTQDGMKETLSYPGKSVPEINKAYHDLFELLRETDPKVVLKIANSIWYEESFPVKQEFLDTNRNFFDAEVRALDFEAPESKDIINEWIEDNTEDKIKDMLDSIPQDAVMYLINAIYFKAPWRFPFDPDQTAQESFFPNDAEFVAVDMMSKRDAVTGEFLVPLYWTSSFVATDIAYGDSLYSMTVVIPHEDSSIDEFIIETTPNRLNEIIDNMRLSRVSRLAIPRFTIGYKTLLNDALGSLGMDEAFDRDLADFSQMTEDQRQLFLSRVIHETVVEVNEEGTVAAAATVVEVTTDSIPPEIVANRPFLFMIRERNSGTILFLGRVMNPLG